MTSREKAGLMFHPRGGHAAFEEPGIFGSTSTQQHIREGINHFNTLQSGSARRMAGWHNAAQAEAQKTRLGIPVTFSTDPRHAFGYNPGTSLATDAFSKWPEALGFGALGDPELIRRFGETVRREYLAVGVRVALHPQIDIATDPRWARAVGTYGEDVDVVTRLGVAFLQGLQGEMLSDTSVVGMIKHFPGGGAQKDGEDPHFPYGREQVYPGGKFDMHLAPFVAAIAAGATQVMPYYGMPVGTEYEEVGFGFNRQILTELLREELGFDGIVCADWSIVTRNFWGVEELTEDERVIKAIMAGVDQFGGEYDVDRLERLISTGSIPESRIDESVRRLLAEKFRLGLFDRPFVDEEQADAATGRPEDREAGTAAQAAAVTVLVNGEAARLPVARGARVYAEGIDADALSRYAHVVPTPQEADLAILRLAAPWEQRGDAGTLEPYFHAGSLAFPDGELNRIRTIAAAVPTLIDVYLDRPALLGDLLPDVTSLTVDFGASDEALLRVIFGDTPPKGRLPFDIPSSQDAILASRPDVPFDTADPIFRHGHGLQI
ncbi:glycoside hydrolase family 3 protein [Clavibacter michiganensis]|nr:glycoside hydrolase family 3 N-terminal domain-containing protein [Clavibacter michiganensis]AWF99935.1 beta-glucosidase [Clavibacter michiganensis subsp. insidiosus]